jgi:hypothetical protein
MIRCWNCGQDLDSPIDIPQKSILSATIVMPKWKHKVLLFVARCIRIRGNAIGVFDLPDFDRK